MIHPNLLQDQDILILSPSEWRDNAVSNMHIAAILSTCNRVAYVETMGGRWPRLSEVGRVLARLKRILFGVKLQKERGLDLRNVTLLSPLAIPAHGNRVIDFLNEKLLVFQVRQLLRRLGMKRPIVWSFSPRWRPVTDALERHSLIFHCVDALHTYDPSPGFWEQYEHCVRTADVVFTPSVLLEKELRPLNPSTFLVGHGCGAEHVDYRDDDILPEELHSVPEPRVVYAGTLANWVDYQLLTETARRLSRVSFVLIGYVHALTPRAEVDELLALSNVYHLGYRNFADLPRYYCRAAVGIVPYKLNEHIRYATPSKFLDYFAAGLPVVTTPFTAAVALGDAVACAATPGEFADVIEHLLSSDTPARRDERRCFAREHTWERQVGRMSDVIRKVLGEPRQ